MWEKYLEYLRMWVNTHEDEEFQGMTPACYDEFVEVYTETQLGMMEERVEAMKTWMWEHCSTDVDYVLALKYAGFAEDEIVTEIQEVLGYSKEGADAVMNDARKWF